MERTAPLDVIAASLRRERERHGISLAELARRANLAKSTLSQLEAGVGNPSIETVWASPSRWTCRSAGWSTRRKRRCR